MKRIKVLSLFDGISVAQQALKELGYEPEYYASEIDKYAISITQKKHPNTIQCGDVTKLHFAGDCDLLIGGSPCQDLSIAKKNREGLSGSRSGLFWEYVRILKEVKPRYFVLENVNSMPKEAKAIITEALGVEPIMINASLVSAQSRKRLFWTNIPNIQQPTDREILLKDILQSPAEVDERMIVDGKSFALTASYNGAVAWNSIEKKQRTMVKVGNIGSDAQGQRVYSEEGKSVTLSALGGGQGAKTGLYEVKGVASRTYPRYPTREPRSKQIEEREDDKSNTITTVQQDSMVKIELYDKMGTLTEAHGRGGSSKEFLSMLNKVEANTGVIRKLTPIECERLQSLPDNYTEGVSNTQRYKALGNAFNCEVIKHVLKNMEIKDE